MRNTKMICTIGPASGSYSSISELARAGMNIARLNMSHADQAYHKKTIDNVKKLNRHLKFPVAIIMDLQGASIRLQKLDKPVHVKRGQKITLGPGGLVVDNPNFHTFVKAGGTIFIDEGMVELKIVEKSGRDVVCIVLNDGSIESRKSVNIPGSDYRPPSLNEKDLSDLNFGMENGVDFVGLSFVRSASDVKRVRKIIGRNEMNMVAKIENVEAVKNFDSILAEVDAVMVARGDLGIETGIENLPLLQYDIIKKCNEAGKPVITATHMLNSMIENPIPTRAEVMDISNALFMGSDVLMLSGETAAGRFPIESARTMDSIIRKVESRIFTRRLRDGGLAAAIFYVASHHDSRAVISITADGAVSRSLSALRTRFPVFTFTRSSSVVKDHLLRWGNFPYLLKEKDAEKAVADCLSFVRDKWSTKTGGSVVVVNDVGRFSIEVRKL